MVTASQFKVPAGARPGFEEITALTAAFAKNTSTTNTPRCVPSSRPSSPGKGPRPCVQRARIGELLGQVRDLESEWTQDAIQRITTENTTLKQRLRQATADNRTLDERLKAALSNLRFQDRRIADLEAHLADPPARG